MTTVDSLMPSFSRLARLRSRHLLEEAKLWAELGDFLAAAKLAPLHDLGARTDEPYAATAPELFSVAQASKFLGVATSTLNKWRVVGSGPEFVRLGRRILYRRQVLETFISRKSYPHTSAYDSRAVSAEK